MIKKILVTFTSIVSMFTLTVVPAFAHAVVKPSTAGVAAFTDFTLGVPSEKPVATTTVKLFLPAGLNYVSPIVKPGWTIDVKQSPDPSGKKDDDGNPAMITSEIDWTGGQIPAGQKDLFQFSAQVPAKEIELDWKVEQTYADGSVVSWSKTADEQPKDDKGNPDFSKFGPYSKTMVVNDLTNTPKTASGMSDDMDGHDKGAYVVGGLGVILGGAALFLQMRKKKTA
jgi:uncharacterized protein YcnI